MKEKLIFDLCKKHTYLSDSDISILVNMDSKLSYFSDITETDIFIDALNKNCLDAIVLAWAKPISKSLYKRSVVGELAYADKEPAVLKTLKTGETNRNIRGVSQEGVPIAQTVVPIFNSVKDVIGVLIMEKDISEELRQEEQVEFLSQTAERLSNTLMFWSMAGHKFEDWLGNGIFVLNRDGKITYVNTIAAKIYRTHYQIDPLARSFDFSLINCSGLEEMLQYLQKPVEYTVNNRIYLFQAFPLVSYGELSGCVISVQDITDLRKKEQELNAKSLFLKEIHHRVKNNLQNIASLLRLQMRRSDSELVRQEFASSINRIISIAIVHEVFAYENWDYIDVTDLINRLLTFLIDSTSLPDQAIKTQIESPNLSLRSNQAIPLALVLNELISNSLKHGVSHVNEGELRIIVSEKDSIVSLSVIDNGPGYNNNFSKLPMKKLGLQIVYSLVEEQLGGQFLIRRIGNMTEASVSFPKDN